MYQALENTVLTPSILATFNYDDMKATIVEEIALQDTSINDNVLLEYFHEVICLNTNLTSIIPARRKRSAPTPGSDDHNLSEEEILRRSHGSKLGYSCGLGRMFESYEGDLYDEMWIQCNWNKSWTPTTELDSCKWVQCINPPTVGIQFMNDHMYVFIIFSIKQNHLYINNSNVYR